MEFDIIIKNVQIRFDQIKNMLVKKKRINVGIVNVIEKVHHHNHVYILIKLFRFYICILTISFRLKAEK